MNEIIRNMVRETRLSPEQMVYPMFVCPGDGSEKRNLLNAGQLSVVRRPAGGRSPFGQILGIGGSMLFGIPEKKDDRATGAYDDHGVVQEAVRALKSAITDLLVITDVCLCEYTANGHCGLVSGDEILNDPSLELLARSALSQPKPEPIWWLLRI